VVRAVKVNADGDSKATAIHHGSDGSQRFRQDSREAAVQKSKRLGISLDWHDADDLVHRGFCDLDSQSATEFSSRKEIGQVHA
jgi:hypothetical protein